MTHLFSTFSRQYKKIERTTIIGVFALSMTSTSAFAGSIILTGHDTDDHKASDFMTWGLTALLNGGNGTTVPAVPTARIGFLGNNWVNLSTYLGAYDNFELYNLYSPNWTDAFLDNNDVLVIGSGYDYVNVVGSTALNNHQADFTKYFNNGGNLFVNTHQGLGPNFYNFIPSIGNVNASNLTTCTQETGTGTCMTPTSAGTASGLTLSAIVQANITHNQFAPDAIFTSLERYVPTGNAITIGLFDGQINDGSFKSASNAVPEPTTLALMGFGLAGLIGISRRRSQKKAKVVPFSNSMS